MPIVLIRREDSYGPLSFACAACCCTAAIGFVTVQSTVSSWGIGVLSLAGFCYNHVTAQNSLPLSGEGYVGLTCLHWAPNDANAPWCRLAALISGFGGSLRLDYEQQFILHTSAGDWMRSNERRATPASLICMLCPCQIGCFEVRKPGAD